MAEQSSWNSAYEGTPPWDIGRPQPEFVRLAEAGKLRGRVLDAGCGTGEHVLLAAIHGAQAAGVDISDRAIERARAKAEERGTAATFQVADVLHLQELGLEFDVVTDSGVFHVFDDMDRPVYANSLGSVIRPGGVYYMMCFSDREPGDWGPRRVSPAEIESTFADGWSIHSIEATAFAVNLAPDSAQAWLATIERV
ncbi:MAG: hypothetical protein QOK05_3110 [Chloroflexota bacterium]|nr:hypothetical protein [Chloroflexota bacterium]